MAQCVQDNVKSVTISVPRKPQGIFRIVRPFISIAEIGVVINHDHESSLLIENSFAFTLKSILLVGNAVVNIGKAGHLDNLVDIEKGMEYRMVERNIPDLEFRKNLLHLRFHTRPFGTSPEIIHEPESTAEQILAHDCRIVFSQEHLSHFAGVHKRISE